MTTSTKHITLILHKLSGSQDRYGTITYHLDIPEKYTYIDLAEHIVSEGFLCEDEGLPNYLKRDRDFVYDFFEDFQDAAVIKELDSEIPADSTIIFSPNYYNYPKDPCLTLNYVYIRKDMRNIRWEKYMRDRNANGFSTMSREISMLMHEGDFTDDIEDPDLGTPCWTFGWGKQNKK